MPSMRPSAKSWLTTAGELRVPEITISFWVIKALTTAFGESTSDYLVHTIVPQAAVLLGFATFLLALVVKLRRSGYSPWSYWGAVAMVGVFGTMAADVLHVALGVPYTASSALYALVLGAVFVTWGTTEHTLSIHDIDSPRREGFYWAAVVATFAMGTALGDFTAYDLHLGYFPSALLFAGVITVPALGYRLGRWNAVFSFWAAYVVTRPLGASLADGLAKPRAVSGLGLGSGWVALVLGLVIVAMVTLVATRETRRAPTPALRPEEA